MRSFKVSNYKISLSEAFYLAISFLLLSFFYVFNDVFETWSQVFLNFTSVFIVLSLSLLFHELVKKTVAHSFGVSVSYSFFIPGFFASVLVSILTQGKLLLFTYGVNVFNRLRGAGLGGSRVSMRDDERGKVVLSGVIGSACLALLVKLLSQFLSAEAVSLGVSINLWIALFSLVPFPKMNGSYILVWNRLAWVFSVLSCLILGFLLPVMPVFYTLLFLAGVLVVVFFYMYSHKLL